ncbi:MAG TPA: hypothetical protein VF752_15360, partial [Thermoleophilaceae bacterium]
AATLYPATGGSGFFDAIKFFWDFTSYRPVLVLYVPLTHEVFGAHFTAHLAWSIGLAVAMSASLYLLLRTLRMEPLHAGLISVLVLLFPQSDSTRLWSTASMTSLAITIFLLGVVVALHAFEARGRRALLLHAASMALYLLSVMTYEVTAPAALSVIVLYALRFPLRVVWKRWIADVGLIGLTLLLVTRSGNHEIQTFAQMRHHVKLIADQGVTVFARTVVPFGDPARWLVAGVVAAILVAALVVWARTRDRMLRRWLVVAGVAVWGVVVGYAMFIPADAYYSPLTAGLGNRTNVLASIGLVTLVYSAAIIAGTLLARGMRAERRSPTLLAAGAAALVAIVIGVGYAQDLEHDIDRWDTAYQMENSVITVLRGTLKHPPHGSTIYTFQAPGFYTPGVPVFSASWDLNGAVKMHFHDRTLAAFPVLAPLACGATTVTSTVGMPPASYGNAVFVNIASGQAEQIMSRKQCESALKRFRPGVFEAAR